MRLLRLAALPLLASIAACDCGGQVQKTNGLLTLTPKSLDYDIACPGETTEQQILLENKGNVSFQITATKVLGPQFALLEALPTEVGPDEQVTVRIGFTPPALDMPCGTADTDAACTAAGGECNTASNTCDFDDEFTGTFEVTTDLEENGTQRASLIGQRFRGKRQDFQVVCENTPGSGTFDNDHCTFLAFDDVLAGKTLERAARLQNKGCAPINVNEITFYADTGADPDDVKLFSIANDAKAPLVLRGGQSKDVLVRFSAPDHAAEPGVRLKVATDDPEKKDSQWAPGVWDLGLFANSVAPALLVDAEVLTFFDAQTGVGKDRTFTVSNTGTAALTIDSVTIVAEDGTTDFKLGAGDAGPFTLQPAGGADAHKVTVTYTSSGPGSDRAKVVVKAGQDSREVRLIAGTEPQLVVKWLDTNVEKDPPVDFGPVITGTKGATRIVRLRNDGQAPLSVTSATLPASDNPGGSYKLAGFAAGPIGVGQHLDVTITFDDAVTLRDDGAKLVIASNDPVDAANGGTRSVDLQSQNDPNFKPVPIIEICAHPAGSTTCQNTAQLANELEVDGSKSTGPESGDTLTFAWTLPVKPAGSTVTLQNATTAKAKLVSATTSKLDVPGTYVVKLTVSDQFGNSNSLTQTMNVTR